MLIKKTTKKELKLQVSTELFERINEVTKQADQAGYLLDLSTNVENHIKKEVDKVAKQLSDDLEKKEVSKKA